jgi:hypothetical protein
MKFRSFKFSPILTLGSLVLLPLTLLRAQEAQPGLLVPQTPAPSVPADSPDTPASDPSTPSAVLDPTAPMEEPQPMILDESTPSALKATDIAPSLSKSAATKEIPALDDAPDLNQQYTKDALDQIEAAPPPMENAPINLEGDTSPATPPPMLSGKKRFQFSFDVRSIYDDNINFSKDAPIRDVIFVGSPKITMNLGDYIAKDESYATFNYNPEAIIFMQGTTDNAIDHNVRAQLQYAISKLSIGVDGSFQRLSGATPDLGERAERNLSSLKTTLKYGFGARLEAETSFLYNRGDYTLPQFADYSEYINELLVRYQLSARTKVAVGGGMGRLEIDSFGSQDFQRAIVEAIYEATDKFSLKFKGGLDIRHLDDGTSNTPILTLAGDYKFTEQTSFGLNLFREIMASGGSPGQTFTRTGIQASIRHKLGERFVAEMAVGYEQAQYESTRKAGGASRSDDSFYFRPSLTYQLREDRRLQLYYMHRTNNSAQGEFDFSANQIGVSAGFDF